MKMISLYYLFTLAIPSRIDKYLNIVLLTAHHLI